MFLPMAKSLPNRNANLARVNLRFEYFAFRTVKLLGICCFSFFQTGAVDVPSNFLLLLCLLLNFFLLFVSGVNWPIIVLR